MHDVTRTTLIIAAVAVASLTASDARAQGVTRNPSPRASTIGAGCIGFSTGWALGGSAEGPVAVAHPTVTRLSAGGPGVGAGLAVGDTILSIDGKDAMTTDGLFGGYVPGTALALRVKRGTEVRELRLVVGRVVDASAEALAYDSTGQSRSTRRCAAEQAKVTKERGT
jgi:membrane-associated protease RseP (regulator of RpoE activity)